MNIPLPLQVLFLLISLYVTSSEGKQDCQYRKLCFYQVPKQSGSYNSNEERTFFDNGDEIVYALRGLLPVESVGKYSSYYSSQRVLDDCYSTSTGSVSVPSIIILQSSDQLSQSFINQFKSKAIVGTISTDATHARLYQQLVSNPSLSFEYSSDLPIDVAKQLETEFGKQCRLERKVPSPSPSRSPRKCNLVTICKHKFIVNEDKYDQNLLQQIRSKSDNLLSELMDGFPAASVVWGYSKYHFSFDYAVQYCQKKRVFRTPTVIILETDVLIPPETLNRYKADYIIGIVNVNAAHVTASQPHIFDPKLSVDFGTLSTTDYITEVQEAIRSYCSSSSLPQSTTLAPIPSELDKACQYIKLCFYQVPKHIGSYKSEEERTFFDNAAEIAYALRGLIPVEAVLKYSSSYSSQRVLDDCQATSTDVFVNPSIIILQSADQLSQSFINQFKSKATVGTISTHPKHATLYKRLVSSPSLSFEYDSDLPIYVASQLKGAFGSECRLEEPVPSPSPSRSPRKCNLVTICKHKFLVHEDRYDANTLQRFKRTSDNLLSEVIDGFPAASVVWGWSAFHFSFEYVVQYCQKKRVFRTPTVIILETDILIPPHVLNQYKADYIIGIVNLNAANVVGSKPHIFDRQLSVDYRKVSDDKYVNQIGSSINNFCSSTRDSIPVSTLTPNSKNKKACGYVTLCYFYTESAVPSSSYQPYRNEFQQLHDELTYALRAQFPLYRVLTFAHNNVNGANDLIESCRVQSTDVLANPTIIVFEANRQLDSSFFAPFKNAGFIAGSINNISTNADKIAPFVSDRSLSVHYNSIIPIKFASSIKDEVESTCQLTQGLPSPTPFRNSNKCSLTTICTYRAIADEDHHTAATMNRFYNVTSAIWWSLYNSNPGASFVSGYSNSATNLDDIVNYCQTKRTFNSPTVIILETDVIFPKSQLRKHKSDFIIGSVGVYKGTIEPITDSVYHPYLAVDGSTVDAERYAQYIGNAIVDFCSSSSVPITQLQPSPSPVYGAPAIRREEDLSDFRPELTIEENGKNSKESTELFMFDELQSYGHTIADIRGESTGISSSLFVGPSELNDDSIRQSIQIGHSERIVYRNRIEHCNVKRCTVRVTVSSNRVIKKHMVLNTLYRLKKQKGFKQVFQTNKIRYVRWNNYKWRIHIPYCNGKCQQNGPSDF